MINSSASERSSISVSENLTGDGLTLELTPLIDIVFMVIVFLLVTANAPLLKLPVDVPQPETTETSVQAEQMDLVISVQRKAPIWGIDKEQYFTWVEFKSALLLKVNSAGSAQAIESPESVQRPNVSIAPDKAAKADDLVKVMALLNQLNISDAQILMAPE